MSSSEIVKINWAFTDHDKVLNYDLAYPLLVPHIDLYGLLLDDLQQRVAGALSKKRGLAAKPYQLWFYRVTYAFSTHLHLVNDRTFLANQINRTPRNEHRRVV